MYFIEKLIQIFLKLNKKEEEIITPEYDDNYILEDVLTCSHNFLPLDSTGEIYACSKCGYLVKRSRLKKKKNT